MNILKSDQVTAQERLEPKLSLEEKRQAAREYLNLHVISNPNFRPWKPCANVISIARARLKVLQPLPDDIWLEAWR